MNKKPRVRFGGAEPITAMIYLWSMSALMMYVLARDYVFPMTAALTALSGGVYMIFYSLRRKKLASAAAFLGLMAMSTAILSVLGSGRRARAFLEYMFKASEEYNAFSAILSLPLFAFVFGFTVSYFHIYLPRPHFLLLPGMVPMLLAAQTLDSVPGEYVVFIAGGYTLAALGISRPEFPEKVTYFDDKNSRRERLIAVGAFAAAAAVLVAAVPRTKETPMGEFMDTVFNRNAGFYGTQAISNITNNSGVNSGANKPSQDVVLYVTSQFPKNLIRQSYDKYTGAQGWTLTNDSRRASADWETYRAALSVNALIRQLKNGAREGLLDEYKDAVLELESGNVNQTGMYIELNTAYNGNLILHPSKTISVRSNSTTDFILTTADEIMTKSGGSAGNNYFVQFYAEEPNESFIELVSETGFADLLYAAAASGVITEKTAVAFLQESADAALYSMASEQKISQRVINLAAEITEGAKNNYQKALAIEKYFGDAEFVYDLSFEPKETTAEYFLFESKRGICSDFASAATLLLRAAGIPAKYTSGFAVTENSKNSSGKYEVKQSDAHAFATAYIEGYGWLEIDGTKYARDAQEEEEDDTLRAVLPAVLAGVIILLVVFRKQTAELVFAAGLKFRDNGGKIKAIYLRTRRIACEVSGEELRQKAMTAEETEKIITEKLEKGAEAEFICEGADEYFYAGKTEKTPKEFYENYKKIVKARRRLKK